MFEMLLGNWITKRRGFELKI